MTKVLITGANGYIGHHVVQKAIEKQLDVSVVDIKFNDKQDGVTYYTDDILQDASAPDLYKRLGSPDVIIHMAWQDGFNHNADSHMLKLPQHYRFIKNMVDSGCPSIAVMGSMHEVGYHEGEINADTPCNPMSLYGIAKNALRQSVMTYCDNKDVSLKWLRGFYITGDDAHNKSIFAKILEMASNGQKSFPFTSGLNKYDFIEVDRLATYIVAAATQNDVNGIINVCSGKPVALKDKVDEFIKAKHLDIKPEYGAYPSRKYDSPAVWGNADLINQIMKKSKDR